MQSQTSSYVITRLVKAPESACLTSLAHVKDDLDIDDGDTSNDTRLTRFITEESAGISRYCNRIFGVATWQDEFRPQHGIWGEGVKAAVNPLQVTKWPLSSAAVVFTGNTHLSPLVDGIVSTSGLYQGMPVFGPGIPAGAYISGVMPTGILLSVAATVAAAGVSLTGGMSVTENVAGTSTQLVAGTDFQVDTGSLLPGDEGNSAIYRLNHQGNPRTWPAATITVVYQAGYALPGTECTTSPPLPTDLESACIRLVVWRFRAKGRDPMLVERSQGQLGVERYWVGSTPGQTGPYPNEIMSILNSYRTPVIG